MTPDDRNPFPAGARPAEPPAELRTRVLLAAAAGSDGPARPHRARRLAWAWAAAMVLTLAGHLYLSLRPLPVAPLAEARHPLPQALLRVLGPAQRSGMFALRPRPSDPMAALERRDRAIDDILKRGGLP